MVAGIRQISVFCSRISYKARSAAVGLVRQQKMDSLMEKQCMLDGNVTVRSSPTRLRLLCKASFGFKENLQF